MEKKKFKNRVFAGLLVLTLAGCKPVLVNAEKQLVQEETRISLPLSELVNSEDINLEEQYLNYLKENNIEVENGNILVETKNQFIAIRDYYINYIKNNSEFSDALWFWNYEDNEYRVYDINSYIALNIYLLNYKYMSNELNQELVDKKIVIFDNQLFEQSLYVIEEFAVNIAYYNRNQLEINSDNLITLKPIIFNNNLRKIYSMIENDIKYLAQDNNKEDIEILNTLGNKYVTYFYDNSNSYVTNFQELDVMSKYYIANHFIPIDDLMQNKYSEWLYLREVGSAFSLSDLTNDIKNNAVPNQNVKIK